jgi:hypothetical protein
MFPSVLMDREVLTSAKRVALKLTDPSEFNGMFMDTKRWKERGHNLSKTGSGAVALDTGHYLNLVGER